jgi:hypothetical protein
LARVRAGRTQQTEWSANSHKVCDLVRLQVLRPFSVNTHQKGYIAEARVKLRAIEFGWIVSIPEIEARYDLVLDNGHKLYRAQVKYIAPIRQGAIRIDLRKECRNNGKVKRYTASEIDVLIVYTPAPERFFWIPVELFSGMTHISFRLEPPKNNQRKFTRQISDFEWVASINSDAAVS